MLTTADPTIPRRAIDDMRAAKDLSKRYLLGEEHLGNQIEQHLVFWNEPSYALPDLARLDINLVIRQSTVHEVFIEKKNGWSATLHNHAGCLYVMLIRSNRDDLWQETRVGAAGGTITQPQRMQSWVLNTFVQSSINTHENMRGRLSEKQRKKIADDIKANAEGTRRLIGRDPRSTIIE